MRISYFFLLFLLFMVVCNAHQEFKKCISRKSQAKFESFIYILNSLKYIEFLQNAQKISRWMNSTTTKPQLIATPNSDSDVQVIILCSQETGLRIRVKSGGHDYEGLSYRDENEFVMIDLCNLKHIDINLKEETVWIQSGTTLGELYYAISQKSNVLGFAGGLYPTVGSGGHISGGGQGTILRKYGLAADNVMDARLIDVKGRVLDRKSMGEDLFWALRGGGGSSFGVILSWKLKLVHVSEKVTVFTVRRKFDANAFDLLQKWQNISYRLNEDIFTRVLIQNKLQKDRKFVQVVSYQGLFLGKSKDLEKFLKKTLPEFELKANDCLKQENSSDSNPKNCDLQPCVKKECFQVSWIQSVLYFAGQSVNKNVTYLLDVTNKANIISTPLSYYKGKSDFLKQPIPNEGLEILQKAFQEVESPMILIDSYGGKMSRIREDEIPFPHRKGIIHNVQYLVKWINNEDKEVKKHLEWIRDLYKKMEPYVSSSPRRAYINYKDLDLGQNNGNYSYFEAKGWGERYFKGNFARLAKIKKSVDPNNFFRNEQSIPPIV